MPHHSQIPVKEVERAVRAFGLTCRYDSAYMEFRIDYRRHDPRWSEDSAYFTTYRDDAIDTARLMSERPKER